MMNKKIGYMYASIICGVMVTACDDGPKTIASEKSNEGTTGVFSGNAEDAAQGAAMTGAGVGADVHSITALEVLPTTKYVYVRVKEGDEEFWIASTKQMCIRDRYFPIYSGTHNGEWNTCVECHTDPNDYSVFSCIICHDNQADLADEHSDENGYSFNSNACFNCHPNGN